MGAAESAVGKNKVKLTVAKAFGVSTDKITIIIQCRILDPLLSLKLNTNTVQFFFNHSTGSFPLYTEASKLIVHPESMVRTHIRNLTLNVYRVAAMEENVREYLRTNTNGVGALEKLAYWLRDQSNILGRVLQVNGEAAAAGSHAADRIKEMVNDVIDEIYYIQDVFSTNIPGVQAKLSDAMLENV